MQTRKWLLSPVLCLLLGESTLHVGLVLPPTMLFLGTSLKQIIFIACGDSATQTQAGSSKAVTGGEKVSWPWSCWLQRCTSGRYKLPNPGEAWAPVWTAAVWTELDLLAWSWPSTNTSLQGGPGPDGRATQVNWYRCHWRSRDNSQPERATSGIKEQIILTVFIDWKLCFYPSTFEHLKLGCILFYFILFFPFFKGGNIGSL